MASSSPTRCSDDSDDEDYDHLMSAVTPVMSRPCTFRSFPAVYGPVPTPAWFTAVMFPDTTRTSGSHPIQHAVASG
jgi:hypothetical protein